MRCLFVHDFRSYKKSNKFYTTNLSYEILKERYVDIFGELYILNRSGKLSDNQSEAGYVVASGNNVHFLDEIGIFTPKTFIMNFFAIKRIVENESASSEFVIIRLDSFLGLIAANYCRKMKKKYLIEVVGCVWDSFWNKGIFGKVVAYPLFKLTQKEIKYSPYVVYVTSQFLQSRYPTMGHNTNISNVQLEQADERVLKEKLKIIDRISNEHVYEMLTVASVEVRYKGQETVFMALAELKKRGYMNYRYHLIGGGDDSFLKKLANKLGISKQVSFHGSMKHDKVLEFMETCDIYIQPSKQEGLPRALIEGMSKCLLCFGTNVAGIPELLNKKMIFGTKRNSYKELADMLQNIDKNNWLNQVKRNFYEAQKYEKSILMNRRKKFFDSFKNQT